MDADTLSSAYVIISVVRNLYQTDTAKMHDFFVHVLVGWSFKFANKLVVSEMQYFVV